MTADRAIHNKNKELAELAWAIEAYSLAEGDIILVKGRGNQRLERLVFALQGRVLRCDLEFCGALSVYCEICPMLDSGWGDKKVVF